MTIIVGISAYFHDSAASLIIDGKIVAAAQEERFSRDKHDPHFPHRALAHVLAIAGISIHEVDFFAFHDKPFLKFERLLETYIAFAPSGLKSFAKAMPIWMREKLFMKSMLVAHLKESGADSLVGQKIRFCEHHMSHAASAFYPSPFKDALLLTMDGVGEWTTTSVSIGRGNSIKILKELHFPHSLGLLYSAFSYYLGFRVNSGEYKVMGLAPYGVPRFTDDIKRELIDVKADGSFRLNQRYFNYATGVTMTNREFETLFGEPVRQPDTDPLTNFHMDIAASLQAITEEVILGIGAALAEEYPDTNLCLAGGVALNCVANGKLLRAGFFKEIWVQPAAGDAGGAVGAALALWHQEMSEERQIILPDAMSGGYLGSAYKQDEIEARLADVGAVYIVLDDTSLIETVAEALANGQAIGWFQGRMEFGPRALGGRSILGDPRSADTQKQLNLKVKYRESFRPFAPAVLEEEASNWFEIDCRSPYMLFVANVAKDRRRAVTDEERARFGIDKLNVVRSEIPAVTHVDYSARLQTVSDATNPRFHALIAEFFRLTGCPMVVNTSFNVRGEPIVESPEDAFRCFMGTDIEILAIGNCLLYKKSQSMEINLEYRHEYEAD